MQELNICFFLEFDSEGTSAGNRVIRRDLK